MTLNEASQRDLARLLAEARRQAETDPAPAEVDCQLRFDRSGQLLRSSRVVVRRTVDVLEEEG